MIDVKEEMMKYINEFKARIEKSLDSLTPGILKADMDFLIGLHQAIERGKKLHPGPYSMEQWYEALIEEYFEFESEIERYPEDIKRIMAELTDLLVVGCRMLMYMQEKETQHKAAMRHDP